MWRWRAARSTRALLLAVLAIASTLVACTDDGTDADSNQPATNASEPSNPGTSSDESSNATLPDGDDAVVDHIVDGDTFRTTDDERIRLLNVDAPEVNASECWSAQATDALESLIPPGTAIRLAYDRDQFDQFGRTLAHVYRRSDGLWVNLALVEAGDAYSYVLRPNDTLYEPIDDAAARARAAGAGLWGACERPSALGPAVPTTTIVMSADNSGADRPGCDPSYPTVCISPAPPDLDCADVSERRFTVLPPDPHHFDGGGDGIGCENG